MNISSFGDKFLTKGDLLKNASVSVDIIYKGMLPAIMYTALVKARAYEPQADSDSGCIDRRRIMAKTSKTVILVYTLAGVSFGLLFPISAILFELLTRGYDLSLRSVLALHQNFRMLYMIDTAPIFLGSFALLIGVKSYRINRINAALKELSLTDELTSLHNRRYARQKIDEYIRAGSGSRLGIFLLDFNKFKNVNDTLGHDIGDMLLEAAGYRLLEHFGSRDNLIRLGGDEFLILVEDMNTETDYITARDRILDIFSAPFTIDGRELMIQASIGVSIYPNDGASYEILLKKADIAMYSCKYRAQSSCEVYKDYMAGEVSSIFNIGYYLRDCIGNRELSIVYQPIVDTLNNSVKAVEALLRWNSAKLGSVEPDVFIPVAEDTGLIIEIGKWVLRNACAQGILWHDSGMRISICVNVSVEQLKDTGFLNSLTDILRETGFDPGYLHLEITESISTSAIPNIGFLFGMLSSLNIKVSFDDFGTGYSSFSQLKNLNIDSLKIDRSFLGSMDADANSPLIISAMINLARNLNLNVIAEGVETREQLAFLQREGCFLVQGYLFSKPVAPAELEEYYRQMEKPQTS